MPAAPPPDDQRLGLTAEELRAIFERVADGIVVLDHEWNYRFVNASGAAMLGRAPEQLIGRNYKVEFPEALETPFFRAYDRAMRTGEPLVFEEYYVPWNRWFENRLHPGPHGLTILFSEITDRKRSDAERRRRQRDFETLAENSPDVIARYDRRLRTVYINRAIERVTGIAPARFLGRSIHQVGLPADVVVQWERSLRRAFAGEAHEMEFRVDDPAGAEHVMVARLVPEHSDGEGASEAATVLVTTRDVTAERHAAEALGQAQRLESIGRLAGGIAHDFNNVLTAILGHADLLITELPATSEWREDAEEIRRSARRASDLVRQLLAFSRQQVLQLRVVDAADVVAGAERMLRRLLPADIVFEVSAHGSWWVRTDPALLEQALVNLVVNARDAVAAREPSSGTISVRLAMCRMRQRMEAARPGTSAVQCFPPEGLPPAPSPPLPPGDYVALVVRDSGVGMDDPTRERAFEPFFTTKAAGQGTGLGLASVHGFATQSGGAVALASTASRGTTVAVYLPAAGSPPAMPPAPRSSPMGIHRDRVAARHVGPSRARVLVVEDEASVRASTRRILAAGGYDVVEARHGADALRRWDEARRSDAPFDLVITDIVMPEMTGAVLLDRLRERDPRVRVLVVSGYDPDATRHISAETPFLAKPYTAEALLAAVAHALDGE